ncbi:GNAT family N-acetyltransferase [Photobacterium atrarenae]|uniref:GNAT family N-acetyltransferase n=1 Tax=Photobacterium atrarenae TaxID=865757 RepID=A0ABY5GIR2_9GAMM|nr:GNAT family N-acetyltransferase [Photobacterium atrarenae]UTV29024.1 GNAT family N-acetyltransferase [Photobacterium atrarenae]
MQIQLNPENMLEIQEVPAVHIPLQLLLEADPCEKQIATYLTGSLSFIARRSGEILGACVLKAHNEQQIELFNIAVNPQTQGQGIGAALLRFVIAEMKALGFKQIVLGTGTFGYQLTFYQRLGFRVDGVIKNYFIDHYEDAIIECGIQHKDMLRLVLELH